MGGAAVGDATGAAQITREELLALPDSRDLVPRLWVGARVDHG
jgi:hypothetical protein